MNLDRLVEAAIQEAMQRGEFDHLKGKGKPLDLTAYFETPEELRLAYSTLKNAGYVSTEVELLQEIAALKERLAGMEDEPARKNILKLIREKRLQFDLLVERQRQRK